MSTPLPFTVLQPETLVERLKPVHEHCGWAPPRELVTLRTEGVTVCRVLDASGIVRRLTLATGDLTPDGFYGLLHATRFIGDDPDLPVPAARLLPIAAFGCPAVIDTPPRGEISADPEVIAGVVRALPPYAGHADHADSRGLHRATPSWSAAYLALARRWAEVARRGGTLLEPRDGGLIDRIAGRDLEPDGPMVVVPGDLRVWTAGGRVTSVDGWHPTWCGDPLSALGPYLHQEGDTLHALLQALDVDPTATPRLEAYAAGHALFLMACAASAVGAHERVTLLEGARRAVTRLDDLAARAAGETPSRSRSAFAAMVALDRLVRRPLPDDRWGWCTVAAAAVLAGHDARWTPVAQAAVQRIEPGGPAGVPLQGQGPVDPMLAWLYRALLDATGEVAVSGADAALRSLSSRPRPTGSAAQLRDAWLADALAFEGPALDTAWQGYDHVEGPFPTLDALLERFADPEAHNGVPVPIAVLLLAAVEGRPSLPVGRLFAALGV